MMEGEIRQYERSARNIARRETGGISDWERFSGFTQREIRLRVESSYIVCIGGVFVNGNRNG